MVEPQGETNDVADGNGVGTALIGNYRRLFKQAAHTQNRGLRLIDDRGAELFAENAWICNCKSSRSDFFRLQFLRPGSLRQVNDGARNAQETLVFRLPDDGDDQTPIQ